jgi:hypothetical protein
MCCSSSNTTPGGCTGRSIRIPKRALLEPLAAASPQPSSGVAPRPRWQAPVRGLGRLPDQRRAGRPPAPVAPCAGVGHRGQQGAGQHRRPIASRRRWHARPAGLHPPASPDRAPAGRGDRRRVRPSSQGWAGGVGGASGEGKPDPRPVPRGPASGGGKSEGNPGRRPTRVGSPMVALAISSRGFRSRTLWRSGPPRPGTDRPAEHGKADASLGRSDGLLQPGLSRIATWGRCDLRS